jgi:hypothetical protein
MKELSSHSHLVVIRETYPHEQRRRTLRFGVVSRNYAAKGSAGMVAGARATTGPSLFARALGLFQSTRPHEPESAIPEDQAGGELVVRLRATIERRVRRGDRLVWTPVDSTDCLLQVARFSPGIPPAWSLTIPVTASFLAGDRLIIGERVFHPVVVSPSRRPGMREMVAVEE